MAHFEQIKRMNIDELAEYFADETFLHSPCYICEYDRRIVCVCPFECSQEYKVMLYKEWLNR